MVSVEGWKGVSLSSWYCTGKRPLVPHRQRPLLQCPRNYLALIVTPLALSCPALLLLPCPTLPPALTDGWASAGPSPDQEHCHTAACRGAQGSYREGLSVPHVVVVQGGGGAGGCTLQPASDKRMQQTCGRGEQLTWSANWRMVYPRHSRTPCSRY